MRGQGSRERTSCSRAWPFGGGRACARCRAGRLRRRGARHSPQPKRKAAPLTCPPPRRGGRGTKESPRPPSFFSPSPPGRRDQRVLPCPFPFFSPPPPLGGGAGGGGRPT